MQFTETKKAKNLETIFTSEYGYDTRKKLNVSEQKIAQSIIDQIEQDGVTYEQIQALNAPYFVYKTQLTFHGDFSKLGVNSVFGYSNLILNKNKSLGVRYSAIDEIKRKKLFNKIRHIGFRYYRNSQTHSFYIIKPYTEEALKEIKDIKEKADKCKGLYVGNCGVYSGYIYMQRYVWINITVNLILSENVDKLAIGLGWSQSLQEQKEMESKAKQAEFVAKMDMERSLKNELNLKLNTKMKAAGYKPERLTVEPSKVYLNAYIGGHSVERFKEVFNIKVTKKQRNSREKIRYESKDFDSLDEALEYLEEAKRLSLEDWRYSDMAFSKDAKITGCLMW